MKKLLSLLFCLFVVLCPVQAQAYDAGWANGMHKDYELSHIAKQVPQRMQMSGDYAWLTSDSEETILRYAPEKITVDVEKPLFLNILNSLFHKSDFKAIQHTLESYHKWYFSAVASGAWRLMDQALFAGDDIYEEANARTIFMMFKIPGAGSGTDYGHFSYHIDQMNIDGDWAKVVITRSAEVIDNPEGDIDNNTDHGIVIEKDIREGYLMQKINDDWKIANIIFDQTDTFDGDPNRIFNDTYTAVNTLNLFADAKETEVWRDGFNFEKCQRKDYCPYGNYTSYIEGIITQPIFLYDKLVYERDNPSATLAGWNAMQEEATTQE
ncbi:MAG: hypothetical protein UDB11_06255 [Peptococcaceae bacterium]|nr:hypothetical protein [Peptococcaceae bacterium]